MAHDLVIRGGLIVDGTGAPGYPGDLAVSAGRITEVGTVSGRGAREIDADGLVVAPGFIDPHTHYDAQLTWDPSASCTSWHGVTTIVTGNCGFTLAPCRPEDRLTLMKMLEYVEGMSLDAMQKGIRWEGKTKVVPTFSVGLLLVFVFAVQFGVLPAVTSKADQWLTADDLAKLPGIGLSHALQGAETT